MDCDFKKHNKASVGSGIEPRLSDFQTTTTSGGPGWGADDLTDIDPADLFDPAEFGYRRLQGRSWPFRRP
jgi:hypothetical protein